MADILTFSPDAQLTRAWEDYRAYAVRSVHNPMLLADRDFFDEYVRREDRYKRMLLAVEGRR